MRLDVYLVKNGFFTSRELAKFNIAKGNVLVNGKNSKKPSQIIAEGDVVTLVTENAIPYVSRGGLKLEKALREFNVDCFGIDALDVGASTGGFTHCLLNHGARYVCAIDVGTDQLAPVLKENPNVCSIENINIKEIDPQNLTVKQYHLIVADLSFISLTKVIEYFPKFLAANGAVITLIKPQFEVGPQLVGRGGIVRDPKAHMVALSNITLSAQEHGLYFKRITYAPIHDSSKNIEYLGFFDRIECPPTSFDTIVRQAFLEASSI
jgi:23S rRNA (cytidine1920-2'-O)/16S rRNA (cytidine1409-2'-O)-methyltransferase